MARGPSPSGFAGKGSPAVGELPALTGVARARHDRGPAVGTVWVSDGRHVPAKLAEKTPFSSLLTCFAPFLPSVRGCKGTGSAAMPCPHRGIFALSAGGFVPVARRSVPVAFVLCPCSMVLCPRCILALPLHWCFAPVAHLCTVTRNGWTPPRRLPQQRSPASRPAEERCWGRRQHRSPGTAPLTAPLAQNNRPHRQRGGPARGLPGTQPKIAREGAGAEGNPQHPAGAWLHFPAPRGRHGQAGSTGVPAEGWAPHCDPPGRTGPPQASCKTQAGRWRRRCETWFYELCSHPSDNRVPEPAGDGWTPAANWLQRRAPGYPLGTAAPAPNPCPEYPGSEALRVPVAMETPSLSRWSTPSLPALPPSRRAMLQGDARGGGPTGPSHSGVCGDRLWGSPGERKGCVGSRGGFNRLLVVLETWGRCLAQRRALAWTNMNGPTDVPTRLGPALGVGSQRCTPQHPGEDASCSNYWLCPANAVPSAARAVPAWCHPLGWHSLPRGGEGAAIADRLPVPWGRTGIFQGFFPVPLRTLVPAGSQGLGISRRLLWAVWLRSGNPFGGSSHTSLELAHTSRRLPAGW